MRCPHCVSQTLPFSGLLPTLCARLLHYPCWCSPAPVCTQDLNYYHGWQLPDSPIRETQVYCNGHSSISQITLLENSSKTFSSETQCAMSAGLSQWSYYMPLVSYSIIVNSLNHGLCGLLHAIFKQRYRRVAIEHTSILPFLDYYYNYHSSHKAALRLYSLISVLWYL